jgi:hypothetical protein
MISSSFFSLTLLALCGGATRVGDLASSLRCGDYKRFQAAYERAVVSLPTNVVLQTLAGGLGDASPGVQHVVLMRLTRYGPDAAVAVPELMRLAVKGRDGNRNTALICIGWIGPAAKESLPLLYELTRDADMRIRYEARVSLWRVGGRLEDIVPAVRQGLGSRSAEEQLLSLSIVAAVGTCCPEAFYPGVLRLSRVDSSEVRVRAIEAIPRLAPDRATAASDLVGCLRDTAGRMKRLQDEREAKNLPLEFVAGGFSQLRNVRFSVFGCLKDLGGDAVPALATLLDPGVDHALRFLALEILADLGVQARGAADAVAGVAAGMDEDLRRRVRATLRAITPP